METAFGRHGTKVTVEFDADDSELGEIIGKAPEVGVKPSEVIGKAPEVIGKAEEMIEKASEVGVIDSEVGEKSQ